MNNIFLPLGVGRLVLRLATHAQWAGGCGRHYWNGDFCFLYFDEIKSLSQVPSRASIGTQTVCILTCSTLLWELDTVGSFDILEIAWGQEWWMRGSFMLELQTCLWLNCWIRSLGIFKLSSHMEMKRITCNPNHFLSILLAFPQLCYHLSQKHCLDKDKLEQFLTLKQNIELLLLSSRAVLSTIFEEFHFF